ncbi:hypothetical protein JCM10213_005696 [Rhodosporidiobolus nylandii]
MAYTKEDFERFRPSSHPSSSSASSSSTAPPAPLTSDGPPTGAKPDDYTTVLRGREAHSKFADPCSRAREESMNCLNENAYDKAKCTTFFQAYRDCKKTWLEQRREDRRQGRDVA